MTSLGLRTDDATSKRMSRQRRRDTGAEQVLRSALHALGYRYTVDSPLPGLTRRRSDLTFSRRRIVVFVDGCFWHRCPQHGTLPKRNSDWWAKKLERNVERDVETNTQLEASGWRVVRIWEHEPVDLAVAKVVAVLGPPHPSKGDRVDPF
jgi:DNA mismatch endonuclease (patch repair protein)